MSLILDALRKSERTRQQNLSGRVSAADAPPARTHIPIPWATLVGLLLIVNVIVLGIIFWRSHAANHAPAPVAETSTVSPAPQAPAPIYRPDVRSLAAEAALASTAPVPMAASPVPPSALAVQSAAPAAASAAPTPAVPANSTGSSVINPGSDNPPPLDTLPLAFQQSLPPLHLDVHGYTARPAGRFVVINMQRYQKGDTLKEGPKVIAIVPDGVILEYQGQQFLLPRP